MAKTRNIKKGLSGRQLIKNSLAAAKTVKKIVL